MEITMAAAQAISFPFDSLHTESDLRVMQTAALALADTEETPASGKRRKSGPMLVSQLRAEPRDAGFSGDYLQKLATYMQAVLEASVQLTQNQSQISTIMTQQSQAFVDLSKQEAVAAQKAIADYEQAVEAAAHKSWLQRVISAVVSVGLVVIGALTAQPELVVGGLFMLIMTSIPVSDGNGNQTTIMGLITSKLSSKKGLKILEEIGIVIGMAAGMAGLSGGLSAALEGSSEGAASAGAANGASDIEAGVMGGAEEASVEEEVGENEAVAEGNQESSLIRKAARSAYGKLRSQIAQMTLVVNPFTDIFKLDFFKKLGISDTTAEYMGMGFAVGLNIASVAKDVYDGYQAAKQAGAIREGMSFKEKVGAGLASKQAMGDMVSRLENSLKDSEYKGLIISIYKATILGLKTTNLALTMAAGAYGVEKGENELTVAARLKDMGNMQGDQTIYSSILAMMNTNVQQAQSTGSALNQNLSMINSRWDAYVAPYQTAVEVMG